MLAALPPIKALDPHLLKHILSHGVIRLAEQIRTESPNVKSA
jgi:hypothetical protein